MRGMILNALRVALRIISGKYIFKFANNGRKPPQKINEGGGLSSVRKKAEQIGGSMKISTSEIFVLEITIPKSEVLQYDKSADS